MRPLDKSFGILAVTLSARAAAIDAFFCVGPHPSFSSDTTFTLQSLTRTTLTSPNLDVGHQFKVSSFGPDQGARCTVHGAAWLDFTYPGYSDLRDAFFVYEHVTLNSSEKGRIHSPVDHFIQFPWPGGPTDHGNHRLMASFSVRQFLTSWSVENTKELVHWYSTCAVSSCAYCPTILSAILSPSLKSPITAEQEDVGQRTRTLEDGFFVSTLALFKVFRYMLKCPKVIWDPIQSPNVTKSVKIAPKIEISAYTVARAVVFAQAAIFDSGTNSAIPQLHLSSLRSTVSPSLDSGQIATQLSFKYHKFYTLLLLNFPGAFRRKYENFGDVTVSRG
ncbi:hypothetical protein DFH08DRAFT_936832 [Mycena albidolilacea]|uniref:Uncharacterized protein n=1 Tax=Mycena albidolilacea TaxID=1033008 RepID=A0AAD7A0R8_9AGAR|nr:hypothetical protein DFH08DRAFT_936832 [Mycena albidolilacea]